MTVAELAAGAERLLAEVRAFAAKRRARDANQALLEARAATVCFPPSGCRLCGLARHEHAVPARYDQPWHTYTPPTTDQILTRMLARRYGTASDAQNTNTEK